MPLGGQRRPCVSDVRGLVCLPSGSATPAVSDGMGDKPRTPSSSRATGTRSDNTDRAAPLSRSAIHGSCFSRVFPVSDTGNHKPC